MVEESIVFGTQKNKRYSLLNNIFYNFKAEWEWDKKMFVFQWLVILPNVTAAFLGTLLPAEVIRGAGGRLAAAAAGRTDCASGYCTGNP